MFSRSTLLVSASLLGLGFGCSETPSQPLGTGGSVATGGVSASGGAATVTGGAIGQGGSTTSTGGTPANGGSLSTGGSITSGGTAGVPGSGGTPANGGTAGGGASGTSTGGSSTTGGTGNGGSSTTGGTSNGGSSTTGGTSNGGSSTGGASTGGASTGGASTGGASTGGTSTGGTSTGGTSTGGTTGTCSRAVGSCSAPMVSVKSVNLGIAVTAYGTQEDTAPLPMAISAIPSGGSRLAWLGTDKKVYVAELDCNDALVGTPFSFPAEDLQDIYADENGGVLMLVRNATNTGTDNCGGGALCEGTSVQCQTTWLVRFNKTGGVVWETQVTNLSNTLAGYDNGARFTWKRYQHHGRIAFDGSNYAAYFSVAITVYRSGTSGCIDIHEGDRMQAVGPTGTLLTGHNSFAIGCSHSWTTRILWDNTAKAFVMTCATDANNCAIKRPDTGALLFQATCSGQFFNGDLIPAAGGGYWSAWSDTNAIRLNQFNFTNTKGASVASAGASQHPHLVEYGASNMLLAWKSGTSIAAQVRSMSTGATVGSQLTIAARDHDFQAFKPYADGSAAYPAAGDNNTSIKIARVMPCQ